MKLLVAAILLVVFLFGCARSIKNLDNIPTPPEPQKDCGPSG